MLCSRHTSRIDLPASASRKMRILSSVVYRLPFMLGPFSWPQTNISGGSKKRSHVSTIHKRESILEIRYANQFARAFDGMRQRGHFRFCQLALRDVTLDGHKMRGGSAGVVDGGDLPFQIEFRS